MGMKVQTPRMEETARGDGGQILGERADSWGGEDTAGGDGKQPPGWEKDPGMKGQSLINGGNGAQGQRGRSTKDGGRTPGWREELGTGG